MISLKSLLAGIIIFTTSLTIILIVNLCKPKQVDGFRKNLENIPKFFVGSKDSINSKMFFQRGLSFQYDAHKAPATREFNEMILQRMSKDRTIFLSSVDSSYVIMAVNLYETSLAAFNITNFLFVGSDSNACRLLIERGIACVKHFDEEDGNSSSNWGSLSFKRKTHYKTRIGLGSSPSRGSRRHSRRRHRFLQESLTIPWRL